MFGDYHIVHDNARYTRRRVPDYGARNNRRRKTRTEVTVKAVCGKTLVIDRDKCCAKSIATPIWNYDWCPKCVRAFVWKENARKAWLKKGIETMDQPAWKEWIKTPEGEYANPEAPTK